MRELIAITVGLALFLYIIRNEKASPFKKSKMENFEVEMLQNTLNQIQTREKDIYPIDTVYFNKNDNSGGYSGRFMFFNSRNFYGVQYDIETDSQGKLTSIKKMVPPGYNAPFSGYNKNMDFSKISDIKPPTNINMSKIWENYKAENSR